MGFHFQPACSVFLCHRIRHLIIFLLCFLITWNPVEFLVEGRAVPELKKQSNEIDPNQKKQGEEKVVMVRLLIGSMPPRCEIRCRSCGPCEAVQVPIAPLLKSSSPPESYYSRARTRSRTSPELFGTPTIAYSRGDDVSNYKPMCWKCKCGNFMFNP